jgi:hypothetical protein
MSGSALTNPIVTDQSHGFSRVLQVFVGEEELEAVSWVDVVKGVATVMHTETLGDGYRVSHSLREVTRVSIRKSSSREQRLAYLDFAVHWARKAKVQFSVLPGSDNISEAARVVLEAAKRAASIEVAERPCPMLRPRDFVGRDRFLHKPTNWDEDRDGEIQALPAAVRGQEIITVWTLTSAQRLAVAQGADIALVCHGSQPPAKLMTFIDQSTGKGGKPNE